MSFLIKNQEKGAASFWVTAPKFYRLRVTDFPKRSLIDFTLWRISSSNAFGYGHTPVFRENRQCSNGAVG